MLPYSPRPVRRRPWARLLGAVVALVASAGAAGAQTAVEAQSDTLRLASTAAVPQPGQDVLVVNRGPVAVSSSAITFSAAVYPAGAPTGWLTVTKAMSAGSALPGVPVKGGTIAIAANELPNGSYRASFAVKATANGTSSTDSVVVLVDVEGPRIAVSTTTPTIRPTTTNGNPRPSVTLTNAGSTKMVGIVRGPIEYTSANATGWLSAVTLPTSLLPNGSYPFELGLAKTDLPKGVYTARFPITSTNSTNGPVWIDVTYDNAGPKLAAEGSLDIAIATASSISSINRQFSIRNVGTSVAQGVNPGPIVYEGGGHAWLFATSGTSSGLQANGVRAITVSTSNAQNLLPGTYVARVPVAATNGDPADPAPTAVVTLTVGEPVMQLPVTEIAVASNATTPTPPSMNVGVQNTGTSRLNGVTRTIAYAAGEPTGWLSLFNAGWNIVNPGSTSTFSVQFSPTSLPAGVYHATITVDADRVEPQVIHVTLTRSSAEIDVPATVAITSEKVSAAAFPTQTTTITASNGGAGTLNNLSLGAITYAAGQPTGWLQATLARALAPATITLKATSTGLPAGTYTASFPVSSPDAGNSPQTVTVTYTVLPATILVSASMEQIAGVVGGANPTPVTRAVTNNGSIALGGLGVAVSYAPGGQTGWLQATLNQATAPATITLAPITGDLPVGQHNATVTVSSSQDGVAGNPSTFAVRFTIADAPSIGFKLASSSNYATGHAATVTAGGANPAAAVYEVRNRTGGTLTGLAVESITYDAGQPTGWLAASLAGATAPTNMTLAASAAGLAAGTYTATVRVSSPVATNSPAPFTYTLTVRPAPVLTLAPAVASGTAMAGTNAESRTIAVGNAAGSAMSGIAVGPIEYQEPAHAGWLSTSSLTATSFPAGGSTTLNVRFTSAALPPGVYHATIPVSSPDATNGTQTVGVTLTVTRRPAIALAPAAVPFSALVGGATTAPATVAVTNGGDNLLNNLALGAIQYGPGGSDWLQATLSGTSAPATVTLRATPSGLAAGTYTAQVPVVSTASGIENSPQTITVTFTVGQRPILAVAPTNPVLAAVAGAAPVALPVAVTNAGGGTLDALAVQSVDYTSAGSGWLDAALDATTAPATLTLTARAAALAKGTYTANVVVASPAASNGSVVVPVTFTVSALPSITLAQGSAAFTARRGGASPAARTIAVTNGGDGTLAQLAASIAGAPAWLQASLDRTTAPATLTLTPNTAGLASGGYTATVTVASGIAGVAPRTVSVSLTVEPQPEIALGATTAAFAATAGGGSPAAQAIAVTNGGDGTLGGLSAAVAGAPAWLQASLSATTAPATLTLTPNTTGLAAGDYAATVTVASTVQGAAPRTVHVTLTVAAPAPRVTVSAPAILLSLQLNAPTSRFGTVAIGSATGAPLAGLTVGPIVYGAANQRWLVPVLGGTTTPATLTLHAMARGLAAGVHTATATVNAAGALPAQVAVTLEVVELAKCEQALADPAALPAAERQRLDALGNGDGTYNLGDYQALRVRLGLP